MISFCKSGGGWNFDVEHMIVCRYIDRIANVRWELKDLGMEHNGYVECWDPKYNLCLYFRMIIQSIGIYTYLFQKHFEAGVYI